MGEAAKYQQAKDGIHIQLITLEKHPLLPSLLENLVDSEVWELEIVVGILARHPTWEKWRIDRSGARTAAWNRNRQLSSQTYRDRN